MPVAGAHAPFDRARAGLAAVLCATQVALAAPALSGPTLWIDEAYCAVLARRPFGAIHAALVHDSSPPLYYDLLHVWRGVFGESPLALRSLSLLLSCIVTVTLLHGAGRFLSADPARGRRAAAWAAAFWALAPTAAGYAVEVRSYALLVATSLGLTLAVLRHLDGGARRDLAAVVLLGALAVYTHVVAWALVAALAAAAPLRTRAPAGLVPLGLAFAGIGVLYVPWAVVLVEQVSVADRFIGWVRPEWVAWGPLLTFAGWVPGGLRLPFVPPAVVLPLAAQAVNGLVVAAALVVAGRRERDPAGEPRRPWAVHVLLATVLVYVGLLYAVSLLARPVLLAGRTDVPLLPLVACVAGAAVVRVRPGALVGGVMAAQMLVLTALAHTLPTGPDERPLEPLVADRIRPGDVVVCTGLTRPAMAYLTGERVPIVSYPLEAEQRMGQFNPQDIAARLDLVAERARVLERIEAALRPGGRLFLVSSTHPFQRPLHDTLDRAPFLDLETVDDPPELGLRRYGERLFVARYRQR